MCSGRSSCFRTSPASAAKFTTLILDLGDVLFTWSPSTKTIVPAKTLLRMVSSYPWHEYECGRITQIECYKWIASEYSLSIDEVVEAFALARDSLKINHEMITVVKQLKAQSNGSLKVYAMSNIGVPDYEILRAIPAEWDTFDDVFISGQAGQRKPDLGFYRHVPDTCKADPRRPSLWTTRLTMSAQRRPLEFMASYWMTKHMS